jgi:hypothetical protein
MEFIIFIAFVILAALLWTGYVRTKKAESDQALDSWKPISNDKPWPYGEKVAEGKIHVKPADVAGSENRVETPTPALAVDGHGDVHEVKPAKKAPAKKTAAKPAAAKKAPAKKKSV